MIPGRELLTARTVGWNVALLLVVGLSAFIAVFLGGASWSEVGLVLGGAVAFGAVLAAVVTPISRRRFQYVYVPSVSLEHLAIRRVADVATTAGIAGATRAREDAA